jgi:hypothetical protein
LSAAVDALQALLTHQPGDPLAPDVNVQPEPQLGVHAWGAVGAAAAGMDLADLSAQGGIGQGSG